MSIPDAIPETLAHSAAGRGEVQQQHSNPHTRHASDHATQRWHALDAVRGFAPLLGVLLHASLSYLPGAEYWYIVADGSPSTTLAALFFVIHSFRMLAFFLIAGFFARLALQRLGTRGFMRDRARRIAVPLLAGWTPVFAAIVAVVVWAAWIKGGGSLPEQAPPGPKFTPDDFPLTHLWFLYVLLLMYSVALLLRWVLRWLDKSDRLGHFADRALGLLLRGWAPLLLALPLAIALVMTPKWSPWFGIPTPDQSLYPNLAACVGYGLAFALGWGLQRQAAVLLAVVERARWVYLLIAVAALALCVAVLGIGPAYTPDLGSRERLLYAFAYASAGWGLSLAMIGFALRHLAGYSAVRRYLADASYWIYLVHLPLLMALQVAAAQYDLPVMVEYPLMLTIALAVMLLSYRLWVRGSWIGALLNGRRQPAQLRVTVSAEPA